MTVAVFILLTGNAEGGEGEDTDGVHPVEATATGGEVIACEADGVLRVADRRVAGRVCFVVENLFFRLLLLVEGEPRLLRTKPLAPGDGDGTSVLREASLTLGYIRESVGIDGHIEVKMSCERPEMETLLRSWLAEQEGLAPAAETAVPPCGPSTVVDRLGAACLAPALAVVSGELR